MWKEMVSEKNDFWKNECLKKLMSNKIGHLNTLSGKE